MRASGRAFAVTGAVWLAISLAIVPGVVAFHAGTSACTYANSTVRLRLASQHVVQLLVVEGRIEYADLTDYSFQGQCGTATVRNTDRVVITETVAGTTRLQIRQQLGRLGPGRTPEPTGISEIEVELGTVTDIWLLGRPVGDNVWIGNGGINLNGDGDADLIGSGLAEITAFLEDGNDYLTAEGGRGSGGPWAPRRGATWRHTGSRAMTFSGDPARPTRLMAIGETTGSTAWPATMTCGVERNTTSFPEASAMTCSIRATGSTTSVGAAGRTSSAPRTSRRIR